VRCERQKLPEAATLPFHRSHTPDLSCVDARGLRLTDGATSLPVASLSPLNCLLRCLLRRFAVRRAGAGRACRFRLVVVCAPRAALSAATDAMASSRRTIRTARLAPTPMPTTVSSAANRDYAEKHHCCTANTVDDRVQRRYASAAAIYGRLIESTSRTIYCGMESH
jgi:hypothetical protein